MSSGRFKVVIFSFFFNVLKSFPSRFVVLFVGLLQLESMISPSSSSSTKSNSQLLV